MSKTEPTRTITLKRKDFNRQEWRARSAVGYRVARRASKLAALTVMENDGATIEEAVFAADQAYKMALTKKAQNA